MGRVKVEQIHVELNITGKVLELLQARGWHEKGVHGHTYRGLLELRLKELPGIVMERKGISIEDADVTLTWGKAPSGADNVEVVIAITCLSDPLPGDILRSVERSIQNFLDGNTLFEGTHEIYTLTRKSSVRVLTAVK